MALIEQAGYRALPALNASYLKTVLAKSKWHADIRTEPTPAMRLGTLVHAKILEPHKVEGEYAVFSGDRRTKAGKEAYAELLTSGREIVTTDQWDISEAMQDAVRQHAACAELLDDACLTEQSMTFSYNELDAKAQIDLYSNSGYLVDLKTIADITNAEKQFFNLNYALQMAWYKLALQANGFKVRGVKILFVESAPPHQVALLDVSSEVLRFGAKQADQAVAKWLAQRESGMPELVTNILTLPPWLNEEKTK